MRNMTIQLSDYQVKAPDLGPLLEYLPGHIRGMVMQYDLAELVEIVLDLGRPPQLRWHRRYALLPYTTTPRDLEYIVGKTGQFRADNRAGIPGTLHRISAIRNRYGDITGVTMRVGRHLPGAAAPLRDVLLSRRNLLLLGPPGAGKTTLLRDAARILADEAGLRVVVVDTSNEIGGDGDVPHPAIGSARRMQVPDPAVQYQVLLEAVKNHTPEVVVIDEIGTSREAEVARTIAARGVQLVATAHGFTLRDLVHNPELNTLVGAPQPLPANGLVLPGGSMPPGMLVRTCPPVFQVAVEVCPDRTARVHDDVARSVDCVLSEEDPPYRSVLLVAGPPPGNTLAVLQDAPGPCDVPDTHALSDLEAPCDQDRLEDDPWSS